MHELVSFEITLRELVITSLFEEDPPCLVCVCVCVCGRGGGGELTTRPSQEYYRQNCCCLLMLNRGFFLYFCILNAKGLAMLAKLTQFCQPNRSKGKTNHDLLASTFLYHS